MKLSDLIIEDEPKGIATTYEEVLDGYDFNVVCHNGCPGGEFGIHKFSCRLAGTKLTPCDDGYHSEFRRECALKDCDCNCHFMRWLP